VSLKGRSAEERARPDRGTYLFPGSQKEEGKGYNISKDGERSSSRRGEIKEAKHQERKRGIRQCSGAGEKE